MWKILIYFFPRFCAYVGRDDEHQRIQILLFPLRSTAEVRTSIRRAADSMSGLQHPHPYPESPGRHGLHPCPAGIRPDLGHACAEGEAGVARATAKAPTSKHQAPEKLQASITKRRGGSDWSLVIGISLELGCWRLEFCPPRPSPRGAKRGCKPTIAWPWAPRCRARQRLPQNSCRRSNAA